MKRKPWVRFLVVGTLVIATGAAMAYARQRSGPGRPALPGPVHAAGPDGPVHLAGALTQDKVLVGGDGIVGLTLTLRADEIPADDALAARHADMVIVLDRSGSMSGEKIEYARRAVRDLLAHLADRDRFALVTYADGVRTEAVLTPVTESGRLRLTDIVDRVEAGGGTNLGAGLRAGMDLVLASRTSGNLGRVVLISDGLANQGVTDVHALGEMASGAVAGEFAVSTVGVGADFNEQLMTAIADRGAGNYTYLENPGAFASVFLKEFQNTRRVAAGALEVRVPLTDGITVLDAGGYPVEVRDGAAWIRPGDLLSGQTRSLFLSLKVPADREGARTLAPVSARYLHGGERRAAALASPFRLACVQEPETVWASIDREAWADKVIRDDYNRLREDVAHHIRSGRKEQALERIQAYHDETQAANAQVRSPAVEKNLEEDLDALRCQVSETFSGTAREVEAKQKRNAKSMQYEGYKGRRGKP